MDAWNVNQRDRQTGTQKNETTAPPAEQWSNIQKTTSFTFCT